MGPVFSKGPSICLHPITPLPFSPLHLFLHSRVGFVVLFGGPLWGAEANTAREAASALCRLLLGKPHRGPAGAEAQGQRRGRDGGPAAASHGWARPVARMLDVAAAVQAIPGAPWPTAARSNGAHNGAGGPWSCETGEVQLVPWALRLAPIVPGHGIVDGYREFEMSEKVEKLSFFKRHISTVTVFLFEFLSFCSHTHKCLHVFFMTQFSIGRCWFCLHTVILPCLYEESQNLSSWNRIRHVYVVDYSSCGRILL